MVWGRKNSKISGRQVKKLLKQAQNHEKMRDYGQAFQLYRQCEAHQDAARVLALEGRHAEAGQLLHAVLGLARVELEKLTNEERKLAFLAASYLDKGGDTPLAVDILSTLGELDRAARMLEKSGDYVGAQRLRTGDGRGGSATVPAVGPGGESACAGEGTVSAEGARRLEQKGKLEAALECYLALDCHVEAGRILRKLGRLVDAAQLLTQGGEPFEAAQCYLEAGEARPALECLIGVSKVDHRYRMAAALAIDIVLEQDLLDILVQNFLLPFLRSGPAHDAEADTFLRLSELYSANHLNQLAQDALEQVLRRHPGDERAVAALHQLVGPLPSSWASQAAEPTAGVAETIDQGVPRGPLDDTAEESLPFGAGDESASWEQSDTAEAVAPEAELGPRGTRPTRRPALADAASLGFDVGCVVADRYELVRTLGAGGMGTVFQAIDRELDEEVALKALQPQSLGTEASRNAGIKRFKQELKVCRQLHHPNLVELYEFGVHQGVHFITMELLVGHTLEEFLGEPLDFSLGLGYLLQVCAGLQLAHDRQVIHRDIKPANLFILSDGTVKVMDFGIAKSRQATGVTGTGLVVGSPMYMAPEQVTGSPPVSPATDLYALGVVAYEMFTGTPPFVHQDIFPLMMSQAKDPPVPPRNRNPGISLELENIVLKLLEKDPLDRLASCQALAESLGRLVD
jgi:serine/threonine-protein kinase